MYMAVKAAARQMGLAIPFRANTTLRKKIGWHISQDTVHAAVFTITPAEAEELLARNAGEGFRNRPKSEHSTEKYAIQMARGWRLTGEPIVISRTGRLLDGQHRLAACVLSSASFETLVVFGIDDDAFAFLGQGRKRTNKDTFSIKGTPDSARAAATALWAWKYFNSGMMNPRVYPYPDELYDFYRQHPGLTGSVHVANWFAKNKLATASLMGALHYLCGHISGDVDTAELYFRKIATGEDMKRSDPALKVRNRLIDARTDKSRISDPFIGAFVVQGWNATRQNRRIVAMRWRHVDPKEAFPEIMA